MVERQSGNGKGKRMHRAVAWGIRGAGLLALAAHGVVAQAQMHAPAGAKIDAENKISIPEGFRE